MRFREEMILGVRVCTPGRILRPDGVADAVERRHLRPSVLPSKLRSKLS